MFPAEREDARRLSRPSSYLDGLLAQELVASARVALRPFTRTALVALATLLVAAALWVVLAYFSSGPLGALYGWSGHPSVPAAPKWVYVTLFLVVLPILSLALGWAIVRLGTLLSTRRS
jgi:hypothetical protein